MSTMTATEVGNQPAFPTKEPSGDPRSSGFFTREGLTKREDFAKAAMQGLAARGVSRSQLENARLTYEEDWIAQHAVRMADSLLAQLIKTAK